MKQVVNTTCFIFIWTISVILIFSALMLLFLLLNSMKRE